MAANTIAPVAGPSTHSDFSRLRALAKTLPQTPFFRALTDPFEPTASDELQPLPNAPPMRPERTTFVMNVAAGSENAVRFARPLWTPTGHWSWANGLPITNSRRVFTRPRLDHEQAQTWFGVGLMGRETVKFICKTWPLKNLGLRQFVSETTLHKTSLYPLHGSSIMRIIGIYDGPHEANVVMELPHPEFWLAASPDMPEVLKVRCIRAYEQLHARGILHGSASLDSMVITGDCRVILTDFEYSRALVPVEGMFTERALEKELLREMRKVKCLLNYQNSRELEVEKWNAHADRVNHNLEEKFEGDMLDRYVPEYKEIPEEDMADPPIHIAKSNWIPDPNHQPFRFIVPGTTPGDYTEATKRFIVNLKKLEVEGDDGPPLQSPTFIDKEALREGKGVQASLGKRKHQEEAESSSAPAKRLRLRSTPSRTGEVRSILKVKMATIPPGTVDDENPFAWDKQPKQLTREWSRQVPYHLTDRQRRIRKNLKRIEACYGKGVRRRRSLGDVVKDETLDDNISVEAGAGPSANTRIKISSAPETHVVKESDQAKLTDFDNMHKQKRVLPKIRIEQSIKNRLRSGTTSSSSTDCIPSSSPPPDLNTYFEDSGYRWAGIPSVFSSAYRFATSLLY
ncbi:hypothetical protein FA15DRAFT_751639 [Coprinopsis marcescibilis]|uniref:Uncharacterized protein n=1 Tax=Coprinopsis marcescibilis TaxID=230819 RepID=A0A5C3LD93_COPMA|nr:hypothetical protein FA15DRAFT_751639 [Coprinopsis marcescibilis]